MVAGRSPVAIDFPLAFGATFGFRFGDPFPLLVVLLFRLSPIPGPFCTRVLVEARVTFCFPAALDRIGRGDVEIDWSGNGPRRRETWALSSLRDRIGEPSCSPWFPIVGAFEVEGLIRSGGV